MGHQIQLQAALAVVGRGKGNATGGNGVIHSDNKQLVGVNHVANPVNLIPVNPVKERDFKKSGKEQIKKFSKALEQKGIRATVRRTLGADINASCGQLRRDEMKKENETTPKEQI